MFESKTKKFESWKCRILKIVNYSLPVLLGVNNQTLFGGEKFIFGENSLKVFLAKLMGIAYSTIFLVEAGKLKSL